MFGLSTCWWRNDGIELIVVVVASFADVSGGGACDRRAGIRSSATGVQHDPKLLSILGAAANFHKVAICICHFQTDKQRYSFANLCAVVQSARDRERHL